MILRKGTKLTIVKYKINELKPHPRNSEFFDDIVGEKWESFLDSIRVLGVIEPLIITPMKVIVSGHQRVRACKELGIDTVDCIVKSYENEDAVLLDLIEINIEQRANVYESVQKAGKIIKERERLYGIKQGLHTEKQSAHTEQVPYDGGKSQQELMEEMGLSDKTYYRYRKLADMIPELSEAVDSGQVTQTTALAMMKQLSESEQIELLSSLDATKKYTQRETEKLISEITRLKNQPPQLVEKIVEKVPDDYQQIKEERDAAQANLDSANKRAEGWHNDYLRERGELEKKSAELSKANDKIKSVEKANSENARKQYQIDTGAMFNARVNQFIEEVAGYIWLTDEINELPDTEKAKFIRSIQKIKEWAEQMEYNIKNKVKEIY